MIKTSPEQREEMYRQHQAGKTYQDIALEQHLSQECVRYWCRRQRDGGCVHTLYPTRRILGRFDPKVAYALLRLRKAHPRWGPGRIRFHLARRASLAGLALPSPAQIGRYLHQWPKFRRRPKQKAASAYPGDATQVHQRWQIDFKVGIRLVDGEAQLFSTVDEFSGAGVGCRLFATAGSRPLLENVMAHLRGCFTVFGLPEEVQTDGEGILVGRPGEHYFPSRFTLWLVGLGIRHRVIPSGKPTVNAEVERFHRNMHDYALVLEEKATFAQASQQVEQAQQELIDLLPSQAKACQGQPPSLAYPALNDPHRPYHPDLERSRFSLKRVDAYLAERSWERQVDKTGQITIGEQRRYSVGRKYVGKRVAVRFDPNDRNFVFFSIDEKTMKAAEEIGRKPVRGLEISDLVGEVHIPFKPMPLQLPLLLVYPEGVNVNEQVGV